MIRFLLGGLFVIFFFSDCARAERACGEARILSGSSCPTLKLRFDLRSCGGSPAEDIQIVCQSGRADAVLFRDKNTYHIPLRELAPGVWTTVGTLREYPKNWQPPKEPKNLITVRQPPAPHSEPFIENSPPNLLEIGGQFRARMEQSDRTDFDSNRGISSLRLRGDFYFHPSDSVSFLFEPQANQIFGDPFLRAATSSSNMPISTSGGNLDPFLTFHQAYARIQFIPQWQVVVGRQVFSFGDEVLVGLSDWENPGRSFDGIRSRLDFSWGFWDLFSTKLWDSSTQYNWAGDRDFHGAYSEWRADDSKFVLQPYLFCLRDHRTELQELFTAGLHVKKDFSRFHFTLEGTGQWGSTNGQQLWGEARTAPFSDYEAQLGIDAFFSSPDFNPLFPSTHQWLGWADVLGRRNLSGLGARIALRPISSFQTELRGLYFIRTDTRFSAYKKDAFTPLTGTPRLEDSALGSEWDLILRAQFLGTIEMVTAASVFFPSSSLQAIYGQSVPVRFEASLMTTF